MRLLINGLKIFCVATFRASVALLPALLVLLTFSLPTVHPKPVIPTVPGISTIAHAKDFPAHNFIPKTRWGQLEPCGAHFDEIKEYNKAKQCVNEKVWPEAAGGAITQEYPPRCFVVPAQSADIYRIVDGGYNAIIVFDPIHGIGGVVGFYDPNTRTVFVVENEDAPRIYRHELQHFFLHLYTPETRGGGHYQKIWKECETAYYEPSEKTKLHNAIDHLPEK